MIKLKALRKYGKQCVRKIEKEIKTCSRKQVINENQNRHDVFEMDTDKYLMKMRRRRKIEKTI